MNRILLLSVLCCTMIATHAQRTAKVVGEYIYYAPENVTLEEAKRTALDRAKLQAMADEFGTIVSEYNTARTENQDGKTKTDFSSIGGTEVKGEWLETLDEPIFTIGYKDGMLVVTCRVKGRAREIVSAAIDLKVHLLRNGTEPRFESDLFHSGDDLYLAFQSPVSGFLTVYLVDDSRQAFCLLPYRGQTDGIYPVEAGHRYLFFNQQEAPTFERPYVDEYTMTCESGSEHNQIYVVFSPNRFTKASDSNEDAGLPRQLSLADFDKWLANHRKHDKDMTLVIKPLTVKALE